MTRAGYYEKPSNYSMSRSGLPEAVLILCVDGKGYVRYKGKDYDCSEGWLAFLEPDTPHDYGAYSNDPWSILWLHFTGEGISGLLDLFRKNNLEHVSYQSGYKTLAEEMIGIIRLLNDFDDMINIQKACATLQTLLLDIASSGSYVSRDREYIRQAIQFMKNHLFDNIDLAAIAGHLGITTFHVIRLFRESLMVTPMQYYHTMQINEAVYLLQNTDMTVTEISQSLNFSSPFYFSQAFKKKTGFSPAMFRKETRK
ncbi:MAG: AraC family transcriptional regulator [Eubacteriales bacterium]